MPVKLEVLLTHSALVKALVLETFPLVLESLEVDVPGKEKLMCR